MIATRIPCLEQNRFALLEHMTTEQGKAALHSYAAHAQKQPMHSTF